MINNRIFGASISDKIKEELEKRQSETGEVQFGESVKIPQTTEFNSRTPFIRMWTGVKLIEPHEIPDKLLQLNAAGEVSRDEAGNPIFEDIPDGVSVDEKEHGGYLRKQSGGSNEYVRFIEIDGKILENYVTQEKIADITRNQINHAQKVYIIGDYNQKQDYAKIKPNESTQKTKEVFFDTESSENPLLKPLTGIKSLSSETEGSLGLTKTTTVQFTVHNFYDYDKIYNRYFLKPGARIFVDFGWSDIDNLYNPEDLLDAATSKNGISEFLYGEKDKGDKIDGIVTKNSGNLEVINGIVKDYSSKMLPDGSVECEVTLVSANSALLSFRNDDEICKKIERKLDVGIYYLTISRILNDLTPESSARKDFNSSLVPNQDTSAKSIEAFEKNLRKNAQSLFNLTSDAASRVRPLQTGIVVNGDELNDAYISWGLFEDYILNNTFGHGASTTEINQGTDSIRLDSSSEFTAWSKSTYAAHKELFKNGKDEPDFLWPGWWGKGVPPSTSLITYTDIFESQNWKKNKYPKDQYDEDILNDTYNGDYAQYDKNIKGADEEFGRIPIRECFIKAQTIKKVFTDNKGKPIKKIIDELLKKINEISGGLFDWKLIAGNTESQAKIIDVNYTQNEVVKQEALQKQSEGIEKFFKFKIMSPNSMVKDFNLEFKLPSGGIGDMYAIKGMSVTDKINSNDPRIQRLVAVEAIDENNLNTIYLPDNGSFRATEKLNKDKDNESDDVYKGADDLLSTDTYDINSLDNLSKVIKTPLYSGVEDTEANPTTGGINQKTDPVKFSNNQLQQNGFIVVNSLKEYFDSNIKQDLKNEQIDLLPYNLDLTIYGISSIVPGDTFTVDYLPKAHLENTFLQVTKIAQNVDSSGWYTSLQTQYRPFYPEKKATIFSSIKKSEGTSRLSPSCLLKEFKLKTDKDDVPRINDTWYTSKVASDGDSSLNIKQFFKYMTNISIETQPDDSRIDYILQFKTTDKLNDFLAAYPKWKNGLVINHLHNEFYCPTTLKVDTQVKKLKNNGFTSVVELGIGTEGDTWQNMWEGDYKPDLLYHEISGNNQGINANFYLPSFELENNTWYRMWIRDGKSVIVKPSFGRLNKPDERYNKLLKLFQNNVRVIKTGGLEF